MLSLLNHLIGHVWVAFSLCQKESVLTIHILDFHQSCDQNLKAVTIKYRKSRIWNMIDDCYINKCRRIRSLLFFHSRVIRRSVSHKFKSFAWRRYVCALQRGKNQLYITSHYACLTWLMFDRMGQYISLAKGSLDFIRPSSLCIGSSWHLLDRSRRLTI